MGHWGQRGKLVSTLLRVSVQTPSDLIRLLQLDSVTFHFRVCISDSNSAQFCLLLLLPCETGDCLNYN